MRRVHSSEPPSSCSPFKPSSTPSPSVSATSRDIGMMGSSAPQIPPSGTRGSRTLGLDLLAHNQLHEVLFDYLEIEDVLQYRLIHSACDDRLLFYAQTQAKDVFGQELLMIALVNSRHERWEDFSMISPLNFIDPEAPVISCEATSVRTIHVGLFKLLVDRGELLDVIAGSRGGCLVQKLVRGATPYCMLSATPKVDFGPRDLRLPMLCVTFAFGFHPKCYQAYSMSMSPEPRLRTMTSFECLQCTVLNCCR